MLEINPFDQPNVQEAKDATKRVLAARRAAGAADRRRRRAARAAGGREPGALRRPDGLCAPSLEFDAAVAELRATLIAAHGLATTFGYGPRFLHSTGQFHKGGPPTGRFLALIDDASADVEIPGAAYSFRTLIGRRPLGDLQTLRAHGLPAEPCASTATRPPALTRDQDVSRSKEIL